MSFVPQRDTRNASVTSADYLILGLLKLLITASGRLQSSVLYQFPQKRPLLFFLLLVSVESFSVCDVNDVSQVFMTL